MDKAKAAVSDFMSKSGHNDTTVHETVAPAVVHETVNKTQHNEVQTAIDKEIHQDHHHTSVQPIQDREVLPEQHKHNLAAVEHREHHHGDHKGLAAKLDQERSQFHDERVEGSTQRTESTAATIAGEHVHHHVHETIQPVVQKEIIQPSVVHTTVPIHEVHHNEPKHHSATALPAVSMSEFQKHGGSLSGREERVDGFAGEPKAVGSALGSSTHHSSSGNTGISGAGPHDSKFANKADPRVDSDRDGSRGIGGNTTGTGYDSGTTGTGGYGSNTGTTGGYGSNTTGTSGAGPHSSGLGNKVDPRVDSDRDGSRGVGGNTTGSGYGSNHGTGYGGTDNTPVGQTGTTTGSSGPHKSSMLNKLDPRVDSNKDGKAGFGK